MKKLLNRLGGAGIILGLLLLGFVSFATPVRAETFVPLGQTTRAWSSIAIDSSNHNVYAVDSNNGDIYKQTGGMGNFLPLGQTGRNWWSIAVDSSNHNVYAVVYGGSLDIYKQTGGVGDFTAIQTLKKNGWWNIAVDSSNHNVYVIPYTRQDGVYKQTGGVGDFVALNSNTYDKDLWSLAVDSSNHDVYAASRVIYKQAGGVGDFVASQALTSLGVQSFTVDSSNKNIYLFDFTSKIYKQTAGAGSFVNIGQLSGAHSIAVDSVNHNVYAVVYNGDIYKYTYTVPMTVILSATPPGPLISLGATTLTWTTTGTPDSCTASNFWSGAKAPTGGSELRSGIPAGTQVFDITCSKTGTPNATANKTVVVNPAPVTPISVTLNATPPGPLTVPGATILSWTTTGNPDSCDASNWWSGINIQNGSAVTQRSGMTAGTYIFNITCHKTSTPDATASRTVVVNPTPTITPITVVLSANPTSMTLPTNTARLTWTTTGNPDSCTASNYWSGPKTASGGFEDRTGIPASTQIFDITCSKTGTPDVTSRATVVVSPVVSAGAISVNLTANPSGPLTAPGATILSWTTTGNPDSCDASNWWSGTNIQNGSAVTQRSGMTAGTYIFNITCHKTSIPDATASRTVIVNPMIITIPAPVPSATITSPSSCAAPCDIPVSWTATNFPNPQGMATFYSGGTVDQSNGTSMGWNEILNGPSRTSGSGSSTQKNNPAGTYTYCIRAYNASWGTGLNLACTTTNVTPTLTVTPNTAVADITTDLTSLPYDGQTTIRWSSTNATSCSVSCESGPSWTGISGSQPTGNLASTKSYSISCEPAGASSTDSVIVNVATQPGAPPQPRDLTIIKSGQGTVVSTSDPTQERQINCGSGCRTQIVNFTANTVTLTAVADPGKIFTGWTVQCGSSCPGTGACIVPMDVDKTVIANFIVRPN